MLLNDRVYKVLKQIAQIYLPALGSLYFALAGIWTLPASEQVVGTVVAVDTFLGLILGISTKSYNSSDAKYDGELVVENTEDGSRLRLQSVSHDALLTKDAITFKVNSSQPL